MSLRGAMATCLREEAIHLIWKVQIYIGQEGMHTPTLQIDPG